ncbi:ester cyclase [soil metagenome]
MAKTDEADALNIKSDIAVSRKPVTDVPGTDVSILMNPGPEKRQDMTGFDEDYVDIVDYIVRCTHKIWEERGLGLIYDHYQHNVLIHTSDGQTMERDKVVADSIKTMAAFPNIRLYADDVIWSGDAAGGFHSSHRITWTGRNTGYSIYGPPTGRKVVRQGIAHCLVKANRVVEEWICRDELALVQQLGLEPIGLAKKMALRDARGGGRPPVWATGEVERLHGQVQPERLPDADMTDPKTSDPEAYVKTMLHNVWNRRMIGDVDRYYAPHLYARTPGHRISYGLGDYKAFVVGLVAAFPDLALVVDHQCHVGDAETGYRVATRWFLNGTHDGPGPYGEPSGRPVTAWGVAHHEIRDGKIEREWFIFDVFALLKQIYWPVGEA